MFGLMQSIELKTMTAEISAEKEGRKVLPEEYKAIMEECWDAHLSAAVKKDMIRADTYRRAYDKKSYKQLIILGIAVFLFILFVYNLVVS